MAMHKVINDPVHGFISIDNVSILGIVDHRFFQRLRHIKQMGIADVVYPGAEHSRFLHSLGAYHLMRKAISVLKNKGVAITAEEEISLQVAILLHDVGHFPFSHTLENSVIAHVSHEDFSVAIMRLINGEMNNTLATAIDIFLNKYPKKWMHQLVSSHVDVDRMDYLVRDSFFSGVAEGMVGLDRILQMIDVVDDQLVVEEKGIFSIDKFLIARRVMYSQVYTHKTVIGAEQLLLKILTRAKEKWQEGKLRFLLSELEYFFGTSLNKENLDEPETLEKFLELTDSLIWVHIHKWQNEEDSILSDLSKRLIDRRLFKSKDVNTNQVPEVKLNQLHKMHPGISREELSYYAFVVHTQNAFYKTQEYSIPILKKDGTIEDLSEIEYSFTSKLYNNIHERRLLFYAE